METIPYLFKREYRNDTPLPILKAMENERLSDVNWLKDHNCYMNKHTLNTLFRHKTEGCLNEKNEPLSNEYIFKELLPEYAEGFKKGYELLLREINNSPFNKDNENIAYNVYRVVNDRFIKGIALTPDKKGKCTVVSKETIHRVGIEFGKEYKAWEVIVSNPKLFERYFEKSKAKRVSSSNEPWGYKLAIARFCALIKQSGIKEYSNYNTDVKHWVKEVCDEYGLQCTKQVIRNLNEDHSGKDSIVRRYILPKIDEEVRKVIQPLLTDK